MLNRFLHDIKKYFRYSIVAAKSQLKAEIANSYLSWLWWVLEPLCFMLVYAFIFGYVFKSEEPYFPVFIFIGLTMWEFFSRTLTSSVKIIKNHKSVVSKVYIPKYVLVMIKIWINGFKMLISFGVVGLMMLFFRIPVRLNALYMLPILVILIIFTFGCSCFLLHCGVYIEDLSNVVRIVLRLLFYMTGIFYDVERRFPLPYKTAFSRYNPMAFLITSMRNALIYTELPHKELLSVWLALSILLAWGGVRTIYKNENSYVKVI